MNVNKMELVAAMAEKSGLPKQDCETSLTAMSETIADALKAGEKVQLGGFGSFEAKMRAARTGLNPRTQEPIDIPAAKVPVFKAGKALKAAIQ